MRREIEKRKDHHEREGKRRIHTIRATWFNDHTRTDSISSLEKSPCGVPINNVHSPHADNMILDAGEVIKWRFEGHNWKYNAELGSWQPPPSEYIDNSNNIDTTSNNIPNILDLTAVDQATLSVLGKTRFEIAGQQGGQSDSGANRVVTDDLSRLVKVHNIEDYPMGGCNKSDPAAIVCTKSGFLPMVSKEGTTILVKAYYSNLVDGTIISPTAIVEQHSDIYSGWIHYADCENKTGYIDLIGKRGGDNTRFYLTSTNGLWYHDDTSTHHSNKKHRSSHVKALNSAAQYELWHQRTAHAGSRCLSILHNHVKGVPKLRGNSFYRCPSCMSGKLCTKVPIGKLSKPMKRKQDGDMKSIESHNIDEDYLGEKTVGMPGQHFHMDFGFVRGSDYKKKNDTGQTITSIDGKRSYLLIIDRCTRFIWIFLTTTKHPPVEAAQLILQKFKSTHPHRTVRMDQGGELGKSQKLLDMIGKEGFVVEPTGSDASAQNGLCERPNRTFGQMMRCILHSADLGPEYWSFALLHAVYVKNRLPHQTLGMTPYEKMTGQKPDLSNWKVFGSKVYARKPGLRKAKLDHHVSSGIFLGFTATDKNVRYIDMKSGKIKVGTHVIFDEAHMTTPSEHTPLAAQTLQRLGYQDERSKHPSPQSSPDLRVTKISDDVLIPTRATADSIGYDLYCYSQEDIVIEPNKIVIIPTGVIIEPPPGTYARIAPRSGLTVNNSLTTLAGVVDPDYRGEVKVVLQNFGESPQIIKNKDKIAQFILEQATVATVDVVDQLSSTERGSGSFGSTDANTTKNKRDTTFPQANNPSVTPSDLNKSSPPAAAAASLKADLLTTFEVPYHISLDSNPYDFSTHRMIQPRLNDDNMLGMIVDQCQYRHLPKLKDCRPGSSSIRIPKWRSQLRNAYITHVNDISVNNVEDIQRIVSKALQYSRKESIKISFATIERQPIHPQYGIPQLYHDQLNLIGQHLWDMKNEPQWNKSVDEAIIYPQGESSSMLKTNNSFINQLCFDRHLPKSYKVLVLKRKKKLTRRILQKKHDWDDWRRSEFKQLNQFHQQQTFGPPTPCPRGANLLSLLWTYLVKDDGTKKARCCCNGSPKMTGSVTLADTYANSLEQTGARIFWAATAVMNSTTIGADATNAFAEAPPPVAPLFVRIDQQYRDWYAHTFPHKPPIPPNYTLPVKGALQGHPESPRLWEKLIDKIIKNLNLTPCTHEPCLYFSDNYNGTGKKVLFLRQVDDFAIACEDEQLATQVIQDINSKMTISVKKLGQIERFNGMDILQTRDYVKIYNKTYIEKILLRHKWLQAENKTSPTNPIPMNDNNKFHRDLETFTPTEDIVALEKEMGFGYKNAIGELIYAMVTCRPDISFSVLKLSQYSTKPHRIHFEAIKDVYRYLKHTSEEGIYFCRKNKRKDLPTGPTPLLHQPNNYVPDPKTRRDSAVDNLVGAVSGFRLCRRHITP